jgi:hypothetical protein
LNIKTLEKPSARIPKEPINTPIIHPSSIHRRLFYFMMNINAAVPQSHHGLLIKLLFVASYINAINASNFLNPISVGIRSAIGAPRITDHVSRSASGRKYEKYQQNYNEDIAVNPDNFNGRSRRNSHGLMNTLLVSNTKPAKQVKESKMSRGGGATQALSFYENMVRLRKRQVLLTAPKREPRSSF